MPCTFVTPVRTVLGEGALEAAEKDFAAFGKKALIVTGNVVKKGEAFARLTAMLARNGIAFEVFSDIPGEPDDLMVAAGTKVYLDGGCDCIIGIGGGSPLDSAKAIAASAVLGGNICDYAGKEIAAAVPPMALIPTTAGTGSEATKFTVITNHEQGAKLLLKGEALLPRLAVVDYTFTLSAPAGLTAATGMDALTHAVEAFTSRKATPLTDPYAIDATKRIFESLPIAYRDGSAAKARESMAIAAYEAGVCISNASVTLVHGLSRPIGAKFHVPHGLSNAMLLAPCLSFAAKGEPERFAKLSRACGFSNNGDSNTHAALALIDKLAELTRTLEIPTLAEYSVPEAEFHAAIPQMVKEALQSGSPANTLCEVTEADAAALYRSLY
ncbi:MAG: iron-containing alcohol dehydrogenase [Eubacteriales bacterium]|nr:iron-containing alcohol dehydrogenase [Eubacteriales bacterium]